MSDWRSTGRAGQYSAGFDLCYTLLMFHNLLVAYSTATVGALCQAAMLLAALAAFCLYAAQIGSLPTRSAGYLCCMLLGAAVSYAGSGKMDMFYLCFMLLLCQCIDVRTFLVIDLRNRAALLLLLFALAKAGVIPDTVYLSAGSVRYGNGFNNPNSFGQMVMLAGLEGMALLGGETARHRAARTLLSASLGGIILLFSGTKTALVVIAAAYWAMAVGHPGRPCGLPPRIKRWLPALPVAIAALSGLAVRCYGGGAGVAGAVNRLLTGRLALLYRFVHQYPVRWMGNRVTYVGAARAAQLQISAVACDNLSLYLLHNLGLAAALGWLVMLVRAITWLTERGERAMLILLLAVLLAGLVENTMSNVFFFPPVVLCAHACAAPAPGCARRREEG